MKPTLIFRSSSSASQFVTASRLSLNDLESMSNHAQRSTSRLSLVQNPEAVGFAENEFDAARFGFGPSTFPRPSPRPHYSHSLWDLTQPSRSRHFADDYSQARRRLRPTSNGGRRGLQVKYTLESVFGLEFQFLWMVLVVSTAVTAQPDRRRRSHSHVRRRLGRLDRRRRNRTSVPILGQPHRIRRPSRPT